MHRRIQGQLKNIVSRTGSAHVDGRPCVSELSRLECFGGNDAVVRQSRAEALPFIVREPEGSISHQWATDGTSEGVPSVSVLRHHLAGGIQLVVEEVARSQSIVAAQPVEVGTKLFRASS